MWRHARCRHVLDRRAIERLGLEENDRVGVGDGGEEQALRLARRARHHDLDPGRVREVRLRRLRVIVAAVPDRAARRSNRDLAALELAAGSVPHLGGLVHDLVELRENGSGLGA